MATLNGQTPQEMAKDIVNKAIEKVLVEIDGVTSQHLDVMVRKDNKDSLEARGEKFWIKNREHLREEYLCKLINNTHKQFVKYIEKRELDMSVKYYQSLIKGGMSANEAHKLAFNGVESDTATDNKPQANSAK